MPARFSNQPPYMTVEEELAVWASLHEELKNSLGTEFEIDSPIYELLVSDCVTLGWIKGGFLSGRALLAFPENTWLNLLHPVFQNAIVSGHFSIHEVLSFKSEWILNEIYYKSLCQQPIRALVLARIYSPDRFLNLATFRVKALQQSRELCRRLLSRKMLVTQFHRISPSKMPTFLDEMIEPNIF